MTKPPVAAYCLVVAGWWCRSFCVLADGGGGGGIHESNRSNRTTQRISSVLFACMLLTRSLASLHDQQFRPMFGRKRIRRPSLHAATFKEHVRKSWFGLVCSHIMPGPLLVSLFLVSFFALLFFLEMSALLWYYSFHSSCFYRLVGLRV